MSRGALANPDRHRMIDQFELQEHVKDLLPPGTQGYRMSGCTILVSHVSAGWHMSISHRKRNPTWEEVRTARYALLPDGVTMAMLLPPVDEYVNVHEFCFHLWEMPGES